MATRYFKSRAQAGLLLAGELLRKYENQNCAVVALNTGGVIVGAQIAIAIHANLMMLASADIKLPGEPDPIAGMTGDTSPTYSSKLSESERTEIVSEFHGYIDQQRVQKFHELNLLIPKGISVDRTLLSRHIVILVADGLPDGFLLDTAADFLKPVKLKKLIIAVPIVSVPALDRMHLLGDELYVLCPLENYMWTDHYYEDNTVPDQDGLVKIMNNISLEWNRRKA